MIYVEDWNPYPNFTESELRCKHTEKCKMEIDFMNKLQRLRTLLDFPFIISSGYRAATHPIEEAKATPGEHYYGRAVDIKIYGERAYKIIKSAPYLEFTRIGVKQSGPLNKRFIHLGTSLPKDGFQSPTIWSY